MYSILKEYDLITALNLIEIEDEINEIVEESYEEYSLMECDLSERV